MISLEIFHHKKSDFVAHAMLKKIVFLRFNILICVLFCKVYVDDQDGILFNLFYLKISRLL